MREHQFIIVMALIIAAGMFGLYQVGITSQIGLTCRNCSTPTFINLSYYQEKFFQIFKSLLFRRRSLYFAIRHKSFRNEIFFEI